MIKLISKLFFQLKKDQKRKLLRLQFLVTLMALFELIGVASIGPFMAVVADPEIIKKNAILSSFFIFVGSENNVLYLLGSLVLFSLTVSSLFSMFTVWRLAIFSSEVGTEISSELYRHYMRQDWIFHTQGSSAQFTKQVATESARVAQGVIEPLLQMNARIVVALVISVAVIVFNPAIALIGSVLFGIAYLILFRTVRFQLAKNGSIISQVMTDRFRLLNEGLGGIKDLSLYGRIQNLVSQFDRASSKYARARGANIAMSLAPRYLIELLAFGSIISLTLFLLATQSQEISVLLPTLSIFALASLKLLPALQQVYAGFSQVRGNISAYEAIMDDLEDSRAAENVSLTADVPSASRIEFKNSIWLDGIRFAYPGKNDVLRGINIKIPCKSTVAFVGPSGSGKSTVIDILLGLIDPSLGVLKVDGIKVTPSNRRSWQDLVGFVPQDIFLSEGTIAENVAFGVPAKEISHERVWAALRCAQLDELVRNLDSTIHSLIGERGVQLSGGQRQRIGIARALYSDPPILVFDEATSALDGITEKLIMNSMENFSGEKTIIMVAHRLQTIRNCDCIYLLKDGAVVDEGNYEELMLRSSVFKRMAVNDK